MVNSSLMSSKKLVALNIFAGSGRVVITSIIALVSIPMSIQYWGAFEYGFIVLINSLIIYLNSTSLGVDSAAVILINKAACNVEKWVILQRATRLMLVFVCFVLIAFLVLNFFYADWVYVFSPEAKSVNSAIACAFVLVLGFIVNLSFKTLTSAFIGYHKPYIESAFFVVSAVVSFLVLCAVIYFKLNLLDYAIFLVASSFGVCLVKATVFFFIIYVKTERDNKAIVNDDLSYFSIIKLGLICLVGTIVALMSNSIDVLIVSRFIGLDAVASYSIVFKVYMMAFSILYVVNSSVIPIIGRLSSSGDMGGINTLLKKTFYVLAALLGFLVFGCNLLLPDVIRLWSGVKIEYGLIMLFSVYIIFFSVTNLLTIFINALNYISLSTPVFFIEGVLNLFLSLVLVKYFGVMGVVFATVVSLVTCSCLWFPIILKYKSKNIITNIYFDLWRYGVLIVVIFLSSVFLKLSVDSFIVRSVFFCFFAFFYAVVLVRFFPECGLYRSFIVLKAKIFKSTVE